MKVLEEKFNLKYDQDYNLDITECNLLGNPTSSKCSLAFRFEIKISDSTNKQIPSKLSDEHHPETEDMRLRLTEEICKGIFNEYKMGVKIQYRVWCSGSIRIGGSVEVLQGMLSQEIIYDILTAMQEYATIAFQPYGGTVDAEHIPEPVIDKSTDLDFNFAITSTDKDTVTKIDQKKDLIKKYWYIRNINYEVTRGLCPFCFCSL